MLDVARVRGQVQIFEHAPKSVAAHWMARVGDELLAREPARATPESAR